MVSNISNNNNFPTDLFDPQVLPLQIRVDFRVAATKEKLLTSQSSRSGASIAINLRGLFLFSLKVTSF